MKPELQIRMGKVQLLLIGGYVVLCIALNYMKWVAPGNTAPYVIVAVAFFLASVATKAVVSQQKSS
jgi:hypothetical protein